MTGQPGDGCADQRDTHSHWCGFCGAVLMFSSTQCRTLRIVPECPRCGEQQWRNDESEV